MVRNRQCNGGGDHDDLGGQLDGAQCGRVPTATTRLPRMSSVRRRHVRRAAAEVPRDRAGNRSSARARPLRSDSIIHRFDLLWICCAAGRDRVSSQ